MPVCQAIGGLQRHPQVELLVGRCAVLDAGFDIKAQLRRVGVLQLAYQVKVVLVVILVGIVELGLQGVDRRIHAGHKVGNVSG